MDVNDFRSLITVLALLCFVGIVVWAYSKQAKSGFDEAARLPFSDDDLPVSSADRQDQEEKTNG